MTRRLQLAVLAALAAVFAAVPGAYSQAAPSLNSSAVGKQLYRADCGQCHALAQALTAEFGSGDGLGELGGPSFNDLFVPSNLTIVAVTDQSGYPGHELALKRLTWRQLDEIAVFLAAATRNDPRRVGSYRLGATRSCLAGYGLHVVRHGTDTLTWEAGPGGELIYIDFAPFPKAGLTGSFAAQFGGNARRASSALGNALWYTSNGHSLTARERSAVASCLR